MPLDVGLVVRLDWILHGVLHGVRHVLLLVVRPRTRFRQTRPLM
jgi:hypothetical protein